MGMLSQDGTFGVVVTLVLARRRCCSHSGFKFLCPWKRSVRRWVR
jgi:hypothetical protein